MSNTLIGPGEVSDTVASVAHQDLLRDRCDVDTLWGEDVAERQATSGEIKDLRREMRDLKEGLADVLLERRLLKKA